MLVIVWSRVVLIDRGGAHLKGFRERPAKCCSGVVAEVAASVLRHQPRRLSFSNCLDVVPTPRIAPTESKTTLFALTQILAPIALEAGPMAASEHVYRYKLPDCIKEETLLLPLQQPNSQT